GAVLVQATVELVVDGAVGQVQHSPDRLFHSALIISTLTIRRANGSQLFRLPGPSLRTFSTCTNASRSWSIHSPSWSPTKRTHQASAWLRLRATPGSTSASSNWRPGGAERGAP